MTYQNECECVVKFSEVFGVKLFEIWLPERDLLAPGNISDESGSPTNLSFKY